MENVWQLEEAIPVLPTPTITDTTVCVTMGSSQLEINAKSAPQEHTGMGNRAPMARVVSANRDWSGIPLEAIVTLSTPVAPAIRNGMEPTVDASKAFSTLMASASNALLEQSTMAIPVQLATTTAMTHTQSGMAMAVSAELASGLWPMASV